MEYKIVNNVEKNELNMKARGGTELMQERLASSIPDELLSKFQLLRNQQKLREHF